MSRPWNYAQVERACLQCGTVFYCSPSRKTRHCSDACGRKSHGMKLRSPIVQRPCVVCGKEFSLKENTVMRTTCSAECRRRSMLGVAPPNKSPRKSVVCKHCGDVFQVAQNSLRMFCSNVCHANSMRGVSTGKIRVELVCRECGAGFSVIKARKAIAAFCSRHCMGIAKTHRAGVDHPLYKTPVTLTCEYCGEDFDAKFCFGPDGSKAGEKKFCSRSCVGAATTQAQGGRRSSIELLVEAELVRTGQSFEASKPLGPWLLDFFLPDRKMVIECDGSYWHGIPEVAARDLRKNEWLRERGYRIARIGEKAIRSDVVTAVQTALSTEGLAF